MALKFADAQLADVGRYVSYGARYMGLDKKQMDSYF